MNKQQKLVIIIFGVICLVICYFITKKQELEQKLCQSKQYEYCNQEQLLKIVKKIK